MIHHIEGKLVEKTPTYAVIEAGGVGYMLNISLNTFSKIGSSEKCRLLVEQLYVRDDMPRSYGFADAPERNLFRKLISVSGVGGASALMMLSSLSAEEIQQGIATGNVALLKSIKGIGEKTAQRIIVDLKGKLGKEELEGVGMNGAGGTMRDEAVAALGALGFARNVAERAIDKATKSEEARHSVEQLIKAALKNL